MLERLHPPIGAPDLTGLVAPSPAPPIDPAHLVNARDVFPERPPHRFSPPDPRPHVNALMSAPQSDEQIRLLAQYLTLCDEIDAFLARSKDQRRAELEAKRTDLYHRCREAEDALKSLDRDLATANAQLNSLAFNLNEVRHRAAEASRPPFDTRFPNPDEVAKFKQQRDAVAKLLGNAESQHQTAKRELQLLQSQHPEAQKALRALVDDLRAVERELEAL